ncbi:amidase [Nocardia arthritidis]|uniref:amidase n=1 Tax=Nocardia arthritidis TaxID=228602 RepID=A0A6G9Y7H8_9NOCA|nr:amidase [Nocardia arthritidis]QIS09172.1 hypothetical protein F5544_06305 [Nocardia arthritidis]
MEKSVVVADRLHGMSASEIRERVVAGEWSPHEVCEMASGAAAEIGGALGAFITITPEVAYRHAANALRQLEQGDPGPLCGVPIGVKDVFDVAGVPTTTGSLARRESVAAQDASCVARLVSAGAMVIGKTNMPEFAMLPRTVNRLGGECVNPVDGTRISGGSSGGSAAAVAAGIVPIALGTDAGGSTRIPAALCGTVGVHSTPGAVDGRGTYRSSALLTSIGPIARTVGDAALVLDLLGAQADYRSAALRGRWVGRSGLDSNADPRVLAAVRGICDRLGDKGIDIADSDASLSADRYIDSFHVVLNGDRYRQLHRFIDDPAAHALLTDYARRILAEGARVTDAEYATAVTTRRDAAAHLETLLAGTDFLVTPTVSVTAPRAADPLDHAGLIAFTYLVNYTGYTAVSVPCGIVDGLPIGIQLIGRPGAESTLLDAARRIERLNAE